MRLLFKPWLAGFRRGEMRKDRLEGFSDGIFAFTMTLLVLDLHVPSLPSGFSNAQLLGELALLAPRFFIWISSFLVAMVFWVNHHRIINDVRHVDHGLVWMNAFVLLGMAFLPFPTALFGTYHRSPVAAAIYGAFLSSSALGLVLMHLYGAVFLPHDEASKQRALRAVKRGWAGPSLYALGALAAWWDVRISYVLYILSPAYFIVPRASEVDV